MSRCFPFPPPGYEKKARSDDVDLLKKEKSREKKHKKEKKNKEKREDEEKREKDRSDGKHRDKKDKKEKHGEKKKDKEKESNKDKDKNTTSEEKRIAGQSESSNGEKLNQKEKERDKDKNSFSTSEEKRIAVQSESSNGEKLNQKEKERDKDKNSFSSEKKQTLQFQGHSGDRFVENGLLAEGTGKSKFVQELGRRIRDEEKAIGSHFVEKLPSTDRKRDERMDKIVVKDTGIMSGGKENNKEKRVDDRKIYGQGNRADARSTGSAVAQNLAGMVQNRVEGISRPLEKNVERRMEEKEKPRESEVDDKRGEKRKDKDREKKSHGKDKEREKEKKKEEKAKEKSERKAKDHDKLKAINKNDHLGTSNIRNSHVAKDGDRSTATEGILKKRKDLEANGFLHDSDVRPNKIPRPSPHPSTENGRKLEPCQTPTLFTSDRQGPPNNLKVPNKERKVNGVTQSQPLSFSLKKSPSPRTQVDQIAPTQFTSDRQGPPNNLKVNNKECKVSGVIESQPLSISLKKSPSLSTQADQIAQAPIKPPHPDSKYLSQVLSVPKMEEWSDFDDQEWLFSSKGCSAEKQQPNVGFTGVTETPSVWAEALHIESADVCALPYVIPY